MTKIKTKTNKSLNYRRDNRSQKEFIKDIAKSTQKENFLVNLFQLEMECRGFSVRVEDYGIDNTGKIVKKSSCAPDFKITIDDVEYLIEMKNSPTNIWTFKVYNLERYIEQKAWILIFWNTGNLKKDINNINYNTTRFGLLSPATLQTILNTYNSYKEPKFGNKLCVRIYDKDFSQFCNPFYSLTNLK